MDSHNTQLQVKRVRNGGLVAYLTQKLLCNFVSAGKQHFIDQVNSVSFTVIMPTEMSNSSMMEHLFSVIHNRAACMSCYSEL